MYIYRYMLKVTPELYAIEIHCVISTVNIDDIGHSKFTFGTVVSSFPRLTLANSVSGWRTRSNNRVASTNCTC